MTNEQLAKAIFTIMLREPKKGYLPTDLVKIDKIKDLLDIEFVSGIEVSRYMIQFTAMSVLIQPPFQLFNMGTRRETVIVRTKSQGSTIDNAVEEIKTYETTYIAYIDASDEKHIHRALKKYFDKYVLISAKCTREIWPEHQFAYDNKSELGVN